MTTSNPLRILLVGSDLDPPSTTLEGAIAEILQEVFSMAAWRVLTVQVTGIRTDTPPFSSVVGSRRGPLWLRRLSYLPGFLRAFSREMRNAPDIVHLLWVGFPVLTPVIVRWASARGARVIVTVLQSGINPSRYRGSSDIAVHTHETLEKYREASFPPESIHVVPPPVDLDRFRPFQPDHPTEVLMLSGPRTHAQLRTRGVYLAFEAFRVLQDRGSHLTLALMNRWEEGQQVLERIQREVGVENIQIEGGYADNVPERLAQSMALLIPYTSRITDLPLSAPEAWACGRPVVATKGHGLDMYLADGSAGRLCEATPTSLANALQEVSETPAESWQLRTREIASSFDKTHFASSMAGIYFPQEG